jgi:hypothetical protein
MGKSDLPDRPPSKGKGRMPSFFRKSPKKQNGDELLRKSSDKNTGAQDPPSTSQQDRASENRENSRQFDTADTEYAESTRTEETESNQRGGEPGESFDGQPTGRSGNGASSDAPLVQQARNVTVNNNFNIYPAYPQSNSQLDSTGPRRRRSSHFGHFFSKGASGKH